MSEKNGEEFEEIQFNDLIINSEGKAGIPFDTLREKFGFSIIVKDSVVYVKENKSPGSEVSLTKSQELERVSAADNFKVDVEFLKRNYGFQQYYQDSIIYSSQKRGIKCYDIIITEVGDWCNITFKGMYEEYCDQYSTTNVIPKLIKFYFPLSCNEVLQGLIESDNIRREYDGRDTLIRSYDVDSREIIFSRIGEKLS
ncbi:MAG: hypothetical protein E6344_18035 [Clostridium sp.]|nr:hypothetical protein [Clostridium sp.]MDU7085597.1 hypothetical protein [Clostridium sp.]